MRIVIDLQGAQTASRFRGIGRYSLSLAKEMAQRNRGHQVWILGNDALPVTAQELHDALDGAVPLHNIRMFPAPTPAAWCDADNAWRRVSAELARETLVRQLQPDVVVVSSLFEGGLDDAILSIDRLGPSPFPTCAVLYDLIPLSAPEKYLGTGWARGWYDEKVAHLRRARLLLAISQHSKDEAHAALGLEQGQVVNISAACDETFRPLQINSQEATALRRHHGLRGAYILCTGAMDERKNIVRLIHAYAALPEALIETWQLALAGKWDEDEEAAIGDLAESLHIGNRIVVLRHVSDEELVQLLNEATLFVFPSLQEGFGLPPLEAMACGTATISSRATSLPEVIGLDEAMFDPTDTAGITRLMERALSDKPFRAMLEQHALERAAQFSWARTADITLDNLERLAAAQSAASSTSWPAVLDSREEDRRRLLAAVDAATTPGQRPALSDLRRLATVIAQNESTSRWALCQYEAKPGETWRVEGPFDSTYSLALVNREFARALDGGEYRVALHSTEGPGDFAPDPAYLAAHPDLAAMHERSRAIPPAQSLVASRDLYPPRVEDMQSRINLLHAYGWEESGCPLNWIDAFNQHLQGVACLSEHVKKLLIDNGLRAPAWVVGAGVDHWESIVPETNYMVPGSGYRFLHVSSCFPRKGADILLKSFGAAFNASDDVCLIIKTFRNPHNEVHKWLADARAGRADFPAVFVIEDDLSDAALKALYSGCDALVAPSKAEGFGLPLAEAMLCGMEVIATAWSGQLDFCNESTAWLVDYEFELSDSHLAIFDSVWARPDDRHLAEVLRTVKELPADRRGQKAIAARELLGRKFRWKHVADRATAGVASIMSGLPLHEPRVGWVSTWNTRCGIATYSAHLVENSPSSLTVLAPHAVELTTPDQPNVIRCWNQDRNDDLGALSTELDTLNIDTVVIQFNYGFFELGLLSRFIEFQVEARGRTVVAVLHSTQDPGSGEAKSLKRLARALALCARVVVHTVHDLNRLKLLNVFDNTMLFPHGILGSGPAPASRPKDAEIVLGTYGFFLPHKGLTELVEAVAQMRKQGLNVRLKMVNAEYPAPASSDLIAATRRAIGAAGLGKFVDMHTDFLPDDESLRLLSDCDFIVYPYQDTGESASGAVRYGLAVGRHVVVTPVPIFDDLGRAVTRLPGTSPEDIASGLTGLIEKYRANDPSLDSTAAAAAEWVSSHGYSTLARRFSNLLFALHNEKRMPEFRTLGD